MQLCTYNNISIVGYMKHKPRVTKGGKGARQRTGSSSTRARRKSGQRKSLSLTASVEPSKRGAVSMREVMEFYKPIKKPVTLRLDADVLAWFRRDGRRYQTRINAALRRVMEKEMKGAGD
jgi:uncharacterized protein (DUF4415 family)